MDTSGQSDQHARALTPLPPSPKRDLVGGFGFLLLALVGVEESLRLPLGSWQRPAPGLFPLLLSLVLAGMALALLLVALGTHATAPPGRSSAARPTRVWWTIVSLLAFYALLERLGFLITSFLLLFFLLLFFLLRAIAGQRWRVTLAISVGASLSSYLVFDRLLNLPLPRGPIGF